MGLGRCDSGFNLSIMGLSRPPPCPWEGSCSHHQSAGCLPELICTVCLPVSSPVCICRCANVTQFIVSMRWSYWGGLESMTCTAFSFFQYSFITMLPKSFISAPISLRERRQQPILSFLHSGGKLQAE